MEFAVDTALVTLALVTNPSMVGISIAANTPIMAITTISSTRVNPFFKILIFHIFALLKYDS